jgi:nucleotide-binding universal stress UspA family protein
VDAYPEIVVGTDGSDAGTQAVRLAAGVAGALAAPLSVVSAWTGSGPDAYLGASTVTEAAETVARSLGVAEVRRMEPGASGAPADALIDIVRERLECLLVVGDRGVDSDGERFGGNTAHQLAHHSPVDLLLAVAGRAAELRRIATTTDGSSTANRGVYKGVALARALGVVPDIVTVARTDEEGAAALDSVVDDLTRRGIEFRSRVVHAGLGQVARTIVEVGDEYDLLVIGNRGLSGPSRLMGSVSNRIAHNLSTNLLIALTVV